MKRNFPDIEVLEKCEVTVNPKGDKQPTKFTLKTESELEIAKSLFENDYDIFEFKFVFKDLVNDIAKQCDNILKVGLTPRIWATTGKITQTYSIEGIKNLLGAGYVIIDYHVEAYKINWLNVLKSALNGNEFFVNYECNIHGENQLLKAKFTGLKVNTIVLTNDGALYDTNIWLDNPNFHSDLLKNVTEQYLDGDYNK